MNRTDPREMTCLGIASSVRQLAGNNLCISELLESVAKGAPAAIAIAAPGRIPLTYDRLRLHIHEVRNTLNAMGVGRNDRLAVVVPDSPEAVVAFVAVAASAAFAPVNPWYRATEFDSYLSKLQAKALIIRSGVHSPVIAVARQRGIPTIELVPDVAAEAGTFTLVGEMRGGSARSGFAEPAETALILATSGTTAHPKLVPLTHANICCSAINIAASVGLSRQDRCLSVMPLYHIHGLIGALLSTLLVGGSVVCPPGFDPTGFFACLKEFHPSWYTAAPTIHRMVLSHATGHGDIIRRCPLRFIRSSSAPLPPEVMAELERVFNAPVIEAYGMTEASYQICSNPLPPRPRKVRSVGIPTGCELGIIDEVGNRLPPEALGEIIIRGPNVVGGYEGDSAANAAAYVNGWFRTGDQGYVDRDGYVFIKGRFKDVINRGGAKIAPSEVEEVLAEHPAIAQAVVFGIPHRTLGEDIAAAVVLRAHASATESDIRKFAATHLADFRVPCRVLIVDHIPSGANGKLQRSRLADTFTPLLKSQFVRPNDPLESELAEIWANVLSLQQVGVHDNFFELGGHSLLAGQLLARVRERFQVDMTLRAFFATPTVAGLTAAIVTQKAKGPEGAARDTRIPRQSGTGPCALSFAQQRLWFLGQLEHGNCVYNISRAVRLQGALQVEALRVALNAVVARHEPLRTRFVVRDETPVQAVAERWSVEMPLVDLRALPEAERAAEVDRVLRTEARRPFTLATDLMLRALLVRVAEADHVLLLTLHHIASDGWSMGILTRELAELYTAHTEERAPALSPLPIQYADYAVWQRAWLQGDELARQLAYWKRQLAGVPTLQLPTDRPRPAVQTYRGARETAVLSRELADALAALSRRERVTLFMTLVAAFATLLHRYAGTDDIAVGTVIAGRRRVETEGLIGFFVNTLVLRTHLAGDPAFRELLGRVRDTVLGAYDHQDLPFEKLVEELRPERNLSRTPLVQVLFVLQDRDQRGLELPGVTVSPVEVDTGTAKFDLAASVTETPQGLRVVLGYNTDLYDAGTIQRMLGHYETVLRGIVADPGQRLSTLPLLTEAERHQLLVEWNDTEAPYPVDVCLHQLVERQVERTPDAVAVALEDAQLTYRELNRRANQLAHYLRARGVGAERLVGVCMERSFEMVIGLLGVLKAGGAYVPLDPTYPRERLAFLLNDAGPGILLTQERLLDKLPSHTGSVLCVDRDRDRWEEQQDTNPAVLAVPDDLAYVIYTSGSTGRPKGVLVAHRGVVSYLTFLAKTYDLGPADAVLQLTSISFDPSVRDIFGPLTTGARVVLMRDAEILDPLAVLNSIRKHRVTRIVAIVLSMLRPLLTVAEEEGLSAESIQTILVSGEPLHISDVARARKFASNALIVNHYGPTECTMTVTCHSVGTLDTGRSLVPAGRPIHNVHLYILDGDLNPVPIGVPGEVHIGGAGVARGYLNRPELTVEKFIPSPFNNEPGARLYKTGDLGRYLPDGILELLGRIDHQVKVRGIRVELGEIEAVLCENAAVREAVVVVREDGPGDQRLVAYIVAGREAASDSRELRSFLQEKLPGYMVPADFVFLDALPLTPNRKVDRRALPLPDRGARGLDQPFAAPRTVIEEVLAKMWAEVLRLDRVGIHDNFFRVGGHSLLAGRLLGRVRERFHADVSLRTFFAAPTVAGLAMTIVEGLAERAGDGALATTLEELRGLSDEDAERLLGDVAGG